ncbi:hypothetical protein HMPREF9419_1834 [Prevotella nigrescens ATCC 33563]|nr:hypothetical protein HMPREF9419_1834 [Prevotella nigrescens ATCC 33563]
MWDLFSSFIISMAKIHIFTLLLDTSQEIISILTMQTFAHFNLCF